MSCLKGLFEEYTLCRQTLTLSTFWMWRALKMLFRASKRLGEPDEPEEGERLFHSQMWVKATPLHFIIDSGSQKNLISAEVINRLALSTTPHSHPYTIGWLCQGSDLCINQQCGLSYGIKPFKDELLCDVYPLEVCDVFWENLIYGNIMFYMSLGLAVLLLLCTGNCTGYLR
jgi:hypothetical protein